jgi:hypothetical protein
VQVLNSLRHGQFPIDTQGTLAAVSLTAVTTTASLGQLVHAEISAEGRKGEEQAVPEGPLAEKAT